MVMALRHDTMPATLHVDEPSPHLSWQDSGVSLLREPVPWPAGGQPRRAGISSFGISGTNAHLILEEAPVDHAAPRAADAGPRPLPWVLSAHTPAALLDQAQLLLDAASASTQEDIRDIGWSLTSGRATLPHRAVLIGSGPADFRAGLTALASGAAAASVIVGMATGQPEVVFVFPGQGAQWPGMASRLLAESAVFAAALRDCADALEPHVGWSLIDVLGRSDEAEALDRFEVAQPALWAVTVALAALWRSYGVEPAAVVGHSLGEVAAACVAGALSTGHAAAVIAVLSRAANSPDPARADAIEEELTGLLRGTSPRGPAVPFYSSVTGGRLDSTRLDAGYWLNLHAAVRFDDAVRALATEGRPAFIEVSPHPTLTETIARTVGEETLVAGSLRRNDGGADRFLTSLAVVYAAGIRRDRSAAGGPSHLPVPAAALLAGRPRHRWRSPGRAHRGASRAARRVRGRRRRRRARMHGPG